jgi:methylated-DNA-[protein]-cysteine S-methyltransferase
MEVEHMVSTSSFRPSSPAEQQALAFTFMESPVGRLLIAGGERGLWQVSFISGRDARQPPARWHESAAGVVGEARRQLEAYFRRDLRAFDLPLHPAGTEFQLLVWNALPSIPYGSTWSYGKLASQIGKPAAVRAVGAANGANPLAIILPCHRVIGSSGALTGYGGGLENKAALLALERGDLIY